jgi:glutathione S-transferase
MNLVLHQHPFASYCQKALIALYELELPFASHQVDGTEGREALARLWAPARARRSSPRGRCRRW